MEEDDDDTEQVGGEAAGVRLFIQIRHTVSVSLWCGDIGGYPPHRTGRGGVPGPGGAATDGEAPTSEVIWEVGVHLGGGGKSGDGI